jgi:hypothetical protein
MIKKILLLCLLSLNHILVAQEIKYKSTNNVKLTIKPHICVAPRGETNCISTIDISWKSTELGNYCLGSDNWDSSLQCWQNKSSGLYKHKLVFHQNISYFINDKATHMVLANAIMKYKSLKPHRKYKKRRSRFPWSITSL